MKNITFILLVIGTVAFMGSGTGCTTETPPDTTDTTDTTDSTGGGNNLENSFRLGLDDYDLTTVANLTSATYNKAANKTYIFITGNDAKNGDATVIMEFNGKTTGSFVANAADTAKFEMETGSGVTKEYFDANGAGVTMVVTDYGDVGGTIKGTFSGNVKKGINTLAVSKGKFEVERSPDE